MLQARRVPFPFLFFPLLFPIVILRIEKTCFLMSLIPLREVSSRFLNLKVCLNPFFSTIYYSPISSTRAKTMIDRVSLMCFLLPASFRCSSPPFDLSCSPFDTKMNGAQSLAHRLITAFRAEHRSCKPYVEIRFHSHATEHLYFLSHMVFLVSSLLCKH